MIPLTNLDMKISSQGLSVTFGHRSSSASIKLVLSSVSKNPSHCYTITHVVIGATYTAHNTTYKGTVTENTFLYQNSCFCIITVISEVRFFF